MNLIVIFMDKILSALSYILSEILSIFLLLYILDIGYILDILVTENNL